MHGAAKLRHAFILAFSSSWKGEGGGGEAPPSDHLDIVGFQIYYLTGWLDNQPVGENGDQTMARPASKRGRRHDAEGAREAIINAAEQVFAEHGFDGARIHAIAATAGYNKSLIFQYYGDKLALYAAVIRRADSQTRFKQDEALRLLSDTDATLDAGQLRSVLEGFVGWYFDYLLEHPRIQRIYLWELADGWQTFSKIASEIDFDDITQFSPVLNDLQSAGLLRSSLNPILQLSPALLVTAVYLALLPLYRVLLPGTDFYSPSELARAREFVVEFVVNGLLVAHPERKL
jgi:TetR/AcrR family transcriptional regulator